MIYGLVNKLVTLPQLSKLCPDNSYNGVNITVNIGILEKTDTFHQSNAAYVRDTALEFLLGDMHTGDILLTSTLLNLSFVGTYNYVAPIHIVGKFLKKGIHVISILEKFDSDDYDKDTFIKVGDLMKKIQRTSSRLMAQKQKEGISRAQATGRYTNRSFKPSDFPEFNSLYQLYQDNLISKSAIAKQLSISRPTLDKLLLMRQQEQEHKEESNTTQEANKNMFTN